MVLVGQVRKLAADGQGRGQSSDVPKAPKQARGGGPVSPHVAREGVLRAPCRITRCAAALRNPSAQDAPGRGWPC
jgi:hypothetical protein